jgi:predicted 3-demethylubiquinone-9 3-methyltransferase (glyoxalase superfamily)
MNPNKLSLCLWFVDKAEEAAKFYCSLFKNSKMGDVTRYPEGTPAPAGSVMTVEWELEGVQFMGLNGGPHEDFQTAGPVSFVIDCADQAEVDHYWDALLEGGKAQQCGWLTDRYGMTWQVTPRVLTEYMKSPDRDLANRVTAAMMKMVKLDVAEIERAARGE